MVPLFEKEGFIICFDALPEEMSMRQHFIKECGWTESQYRKIKSFDWFMAKVSAWKDGVQLADDYLGACCYESKAEFYTKYKDDYFADMVKTVIDEAKKVSA